MALWHVKVYCVYNMVCCSTVCYAIVCCSASYSPTCLYIAGNYIVFLHSVVYSTVQCGIVQ